MQPLTTGDDRTLFVPTGIRNDETTFASESFWKKNAEKIDPSEAFFHKYYSMKGQGKQAANRKKSKKAVARDDSNEGSVGDEEEIWKALVDSRPELGEDDEDENTDMNDLESAMGSDDEESAPEEDMDDGEEVGLDENMSDVLDDDDEVPEGDIGAKDSLPDALPSKGSGKQKRRKLKHLPTFASADEYAHMLGDDDDQ